VTNEENPSESVGVKKKKKKRTTNLSYASLCREVILEKIFYSSSHILGFPRFKYPMRFVIHFVGLSLVDEFFLHIENFPLLKVLVSTGSSLLCFIHFIILHIIYLGKI